MGNPFSIQEQKIETKLFFILTLIAFLFSVAVRYIWVYQFSGTDSFYWNGQLMINTNDGYYWAEGARDILAGMHQPNDLSPIDRPLAHLTAFLAKILPVSFETLILWMPSFLASLIVIPIMLIGRVFKIERVAFVASLLASITWSYYNRTMTGYYDTDLLIIVLPTFMVWGVLYTLKTEHNRALVLAPLLAILATYWHDGNANIVNGTFFIVLFYTLIFKRKEIYYYKFLSVFIISMTTLPISIKIILIVALTTLYYLYKSKLTHQHIMIITAISTVLFFIFGGMAWISGILSNGYLTRAINTDISDTNMTLHFYSVVNTVREAGHIPFETFANRISGDKVTFWLSIIGYIMLVVRYRLFIVALPMIALGFFAIQGGLRFTVFAIPFMAFGIAYLIVFLSEKFLKSAKPIVRYALIGILTLFVLIPNINHIIGYKVPTVFTKNEVAVLDKLKHIASREDYVLTWWDYGYPIRYYSDVKTLIDGGKHSGGPNFPVSFAMLNNQIVGANMARLDVEFTEKNFKEHCGATALECMMKYYNLSDPKKFIQSINKKDIKLPKKTRDVYLYFPFRMMNIIPTIDLFSNLDLKTGKQFTRPMFYVTSLSGATGGVLNLSNGMKIVNGYLKAGRQSLPINQIVSTVYDNKGILHKQVQRFNIGAPFYIIYMKNFNRVLILDKRMFNSTYIQLFVLENYDKDLYEPTILTPMVKVFKLKI